VIPRDYITEWRAHAPWADNAQVEQDLAICRALVNIFSHPVLSNALAFRGGTALYKLYLTPAERYSEDLDFVQVRPEPAGAVMDALHEVLDPWLGKPQRKQTEGRVTFNYRFSSEDPTPLPLRLKVEVNTREHFTTHGFRRVPFKVASRWFNGSADITTLSREKKHSRTDAVFHAGKQSFNHFCTLDCVCAAARGATELAGPERQQIETWQNRAITIG